MKRKRDRADCMEASILESISDGVFTVDENWRITSFNRAAEEITGISRDEAIGRFCHEVFRSSMCEGACALKQTLETGDPVVGRSCFVVNAAGDRLPISVSTAVLRDDAGRVVGGAETFRDLSEVEALRQELEGRHRLGDMVSRSPAMRRIFELVPTVAASPSTVLIHGETGTGKELLARAIHEAGPRAKEPFVAVNCGALPDGLLESELFGHVKGAFTGAVADRPGRFVQAGGGTLFLDEIGEVSPAMQVRLLRVLQERSVEPLGGSGKRPVRARIVAATHRDLAVEMREGRFREDLYYRIHVLRIELPPLRERMEDLPLLVQSFVTRFNRLQGRHVELVEADAMGLLMAHSWPGNVRELENVIERAFIVCGGSRITVACLPSELRGSPSPAKGRSPRGQGEGAGLGATKDEAERRAIVEALERNGWSRLAAAKELGIHKATLHRKMRRLAIDTAGRDGRRREPADPA